jgi:hypothetical protein
LLTNEGINQWIAAYQEAATLRRDFADRGWETIKLQISLGSLLISAVIGGAISLFSYSQSADLPILIRVFAAVGLSVIAGIVFCFSEICWTNFYRECERMYKQIATLSKISEKLGLYVERENEKLTVRGDSRYVSDDYIIEDAFDGNGKPIEITTDIFIEQNMQSSRVGKNGKRVSTFYGTMRNIFLTFEIMSVISAGVVILLLIVSVV